MSQTITVGREEIDFKLTSKESGGELAVFDVRMPAGGGPPMLHRHDPFELYRVRRGELAIYLETASGGVRRAVAGPGAVVPIAGGLEHTIRNESDEPAEATVVFAPGEAMERFARTAGELGGDGPPSPDEVAALAAAHGIEITRSIDQALTDPGNGGYLTVARFSGDPDELSRRYRAYASELDEVGRDHGLILHAGARTDEGFMVVNIWPARDNSQAAARDPRRLGIVDRALMAPDEVRREHHEVERLVVFD